MSRTAIALNKLNDATRKYLNDLTHDYSKYRTDKMLEARYKGIIIGLLRGLQHMNVITEVDFRLLLNYATL